MPRLGRLDRVAPVVAGAVGHERDQVLVPALLPRPARIEPGAEHPHQRQVGQFAAASEGVGLARHALMQRRDQPADVVLHVKQSRICWPSP